MRFPFFSKKKDRYVLVISWGWMRGFYGWGVFKAIDELWLRDRVDAIYWVSAWGLLASYWAAWYNADKIVELFLNSEFLDLSKDLNLLPKASMLSNKMLKKQIERDLPETFEELKIPTYIWCTDTNEWQNVILSSWDLSSALMWTIAIPWIFPAIEREWMCLIDGWVTNNFPLAIAKEKGIQIKNKAGELVELAKEKGTPVLEKAANDVRDKAIVVVQDVLNKLEKSKEKANKK